MYSFCHAQKIAVTCQKKKAKALFESMNVFEKVSQVFAYFFLLKDTEYRQNTRKVLWIEVLVKKSCKLVKRMKAKSS